MDRKKLTKVVLAAVVGTASFVAPNAHAVIIGGLDTDAAPANALRTTLTFDRITNNNTDNIESFMFVDVIDPGTPNQVLFQFRLEDTGIAGQAPFLSDLYFDDGTLFGINTLIDADEPSPFGFFAAHTTVDFTDPIGGGNPNLPAGNNAIPPFVATSDFSADEDPGNGTRLNEGDWLGILFDLVGGQDIESILFALDTTNFPNYINDPTGLLRIGIHAQGIPGSDSFVNDPHDGGPGGQPGGGGGPGPGGVIPEPVTATTALMALGGVLLSTNRRRRA